MNTFILDIASIEQALLYDKKLLYYSFELVPMILKSKNT